MSGAVSAAEEEGFRNDDAALIREAELVLEERDKAGLAGLTGDLACIIISTEPDRQQVHGF